jgi:hypothetical protein
MIVISYRKLQIVSNGNKTIVERIQSKGAWNLEKKTRTCRKKRKFEAKSISEAKLKNGDIDQWN